MDIKTKIKFLEEIESLCYTLYNIRRVDYATIFNDYGFNIKNNGIIKNVSITNDEYNIWIEKHLVTNKKQDRLGLTIFCENYFKFENYTDVYTGAGITYQQEKGEYSNIDPTKIYSSLSSEEFFNISLVNTEDYIPSFDTHLDNLELFYNTELSDLTICGINHKGKPPFEFFKFNKEKNMYNIEMLLSEMKYMAKCLE